MNFRSKMWKAWREYQYLRWLAYVASALVPMLSLAGGGCGDARPSSPRRPRSSPAATRRGMACRRRRARPLRQVSLRSRCGSCSPRCPSSCRSACCCGRSRSPRSPRTAKVHGGSRRRRPPRRSGPATAGASAGRCWAWGRDAGSTRAGCCMCSRGRREALRRRTTRWRCAGGTPRWGSGG